MYRFATAAGAGRYVQWLNSYGVPSTAVGHVANFTATGIPGAIGLSYVQAATVGLANGKTFPIATVVFSRAALVLRASAGGEQGAPSAPLPSAALQAAQHLASNVGTH